MKFLANENFPLPIVNALRDRGEDEDNARAIAVFSSGEIAPGRFVVVESDRIRVRPLPSVPPSAG